MRVVVGAFPPVSWDNQSNSGHGLLILSIGGHGVLHAASFTIQNWRRPKLVFISAGDPWM